MWLKVEDKVLEKYPEMEIGYLVARVSVKNRDPFVESLKERLGKHLQEQGINALNFAVHSSISLWRKIYEEDFQVKAKTYRSSIEALLRRVVTGKEMWNICNVVDLYNCCSILSLLPMGGYDLKKILGDITIRYAKEGEYFLGLGEREKIAVKSHHVVYADDERIMCWLWNHKDSAETCIDESSNYVLFFIDSFKCDTVQNALKLLAENLTKIECQPLETGVLNRSVPQKEINLSSFFC
ncbi:MAG: hypothetical protein FJZ63_06905 [Chlamydiae bacterium]|nr:hypothetical protein [Chlamydiota bacterium]